MEAQFRYLSRREASQYHTDIGLRIAPATLGKLASVGGGPQYRRFGRDAVYTTADLDAWANQRLGDARSSTSQRAA